MYKYFFLLLSLVGGVKSNQEEKDLINYLFEDHNPNVRPVFEFNEPTCAPRRIIPKRIKN